MLYEVITGRRLQGRLKQRLQQGHPLHHGRLVKIEAMVVVTRLQIGTDHQIGRLTAALLHPFQHVAGVVAGAKGTAVDHVKAEPVGRITSYNVCYTKLLRV